MSPVSRLYWDRCSWEEKVSVKICFRGDLEGEGNLAFLFVHALIGQAAKEDAIGGVVGVDGHANACGDVEGIAVDADPLVQGMGDTGGTGPGEQVSRLVAGQVGGDDDELIASQAGQSIGDADGGAEIGGDVP